jgi:hypothetical protein
MMRTKVYWHAVGSCQWQQPDFLGAGIARRRIRNEDAARSIVTLTGGPQHATACAPPDHGLLKSHGINAGQCAVRQSILFAFTGWHRTPGFVSRNAIRFSIAGTPIKDGT